MKKIVIVVLVLLVAVLAACSREPEPEPAPSNNVIETMPVPVVPMAAPLLVDEYAHENFEWQSHEFTLEDRNITLQLPKGVKISPNIGECSLESTRETVPPGFLISSVYEEIKVGRIYFPENYEKIDDNTYQASILTGAYEKEEDLITYTYSDEIKDDVFFKYDKYIVFLSDARGLFDAIEYYDEESGVMISFWRPQNEAVFEKQGMPMFEDIVSTVVVSAADEE